MEKTDKDDNLIIDVRHSMLNIWKSISPNVPPLMFQGSNLRTDTACQYETDQK